MMKSDVRDLKLWWYLSSANKALKWLKVPGNLSNKVGSININNTVS